MEACVDDEYGGCVPAALHKKICEFNTLASDGRWDTLSYGAFRKQMNGMGLSTRDTQRLFQLQVDVGHVLPDPSKRRQPDREDYGWNLLAQPHPENRRLGHAPVNCAMAQRWCRTGVQCINPTPEL